MFTAAPYDVIWVGAQCVRIALVAEQSWAGRKPMEQGASTMPELQYFPDQMLDPMLPPLERLAAADEVAKLGDPRPGVSLRPEGVPDIAWVEVPSGDFIRWEEHTSERK